MRERVRAGLFGIAVIALAASAGALPACARSVAPFDGATDAIVPGDRDVREVDDRPARDVPTVDRPPGLVVAEQLALGEGHSCVRMSDGSVRCWGLNDHGQLGEGTGMNRGRPTRVPGLANVTQIAAGGASTCGLLADGTVRCWGANTGGTVGDGTMTDRAIPTTVTNVEGAVQIAMGDGHACALSMDGRVRCWGQNYFGQIGDGTRIARPSAVVLGSLGNVSRLDLGKAHSCAVMPDATARCWGANIQGELGLDASPEAQLTPLLLREPTDIASLAPGSLHLCARRRDGSVLCWGFHGVGQIGDGMRGVSRQPRPTLVAALPPVVDLHSSESHSCARTAIGEVFCWGGNANSEFGDGTSMDRVSPAPVPALAGLTHLALGSFHSCGIDPDGSVRCWGDNYAGQVGDGSTVLRRSPVAVLIP